MKEKIHFKKNKDGGRSVNVMLADFAYYNRYTFNTLFTPLGIGLIAQYAKQQFGDKIDVSLFKNIDKFLNSAIQNPPDVVGLSIYYWNTAQNQYVVNRLREMFGQDVIIILGGPSIDDDKEELHRYLTTVFSAADALIVNEG
jgi:hypothetical protein